MALTRRTKPISVVEARRLYEQTNLPIRHIASMHGMGLRAFYRRVHRWGWRLRKPRLSLTDPPRGPDETLGETTLATAGGMDVVGTATRIFAAVTCELDAVETLIKQLTPDASAEHERAQRMLASLARTLQEITRLHLPSARSEKDADDRGAADTAEFIEELVRRMDEFARRRQAGIPGEPAAEKA